MSADCRKELRVAESDVQRSVATHGNARDSVIGAASVNAVMAFDEGEEFFQEKIFVARFAVAGVDIETCAARWCGDEEFFQLAFFPCVFDEVPRAGVIEHLFVVAEAVKEKENWKASRGLRVVARRKDYTVGDGARKNFAGKAVAFDAALGRRGFNIRRTDERGDANEG